MNLPSRANVVIIGGGIIGCSIAYHLTKSGVRDVLLLERRQLCCGTTWHSVGSVAELRGSRKMTELASYTAELYRNLEAETGQATGYKKTGSVMLVLNKERLMEVERTAALARAYGKEAHIISVAEVRQRCEQVITDDVLAGFYIPTDGRTNPVDTTQALAKGARMRGAQILEGVCVSALDVVDGKVRGVLTQHGPVRADVVVLAGGMWSREFAAPYGVSLPLQAAEHFYAVTESMEGLPRDMPFIRVPDESTYYKEDAGKLLFGCLERVAKPWALDGIPADFCFDALPADLDHFEPILTTAVERFPLLATTGIQLFFNGPESFTPDGNALLGETPEVEGLFVACGLNTVGVMAGGAMGRILSEWIDKRRRPEGCSEFDVARISPSQSGRNYLRDRTKEAVGVLYDIGWPNREYVSGRGGRRGPLHEHHMAANAVTGSRAGWEVPLFYAPPGDSRELHCSFGRQSWVPWVAEECRRACETHALFDLSAYAKVELTREATQVLMERISASAIGPGVSRSLWLTDSASVRASVWVVRLPDERALILSAPGAERLLIQWLRRHSSDLPAHAVREVSSTYAAFLLLGPQGDELLHKAGARWPEGVATAQTEVGYAPAWISPMALGAISGRLMVTPVEFAAHAFQTLESLSAASLRKAGAYALEALRIDASEPAWPADLDDTVTPGQAGLASLIEVDRNGFIGHNAVVRERASGLFETRLVRIALSEDRGALYGQEAIWRDGVCVGLTTSGAWSHTARVPIALGYVSDPSGLDIAWFRGQFEIDMPGGRVAATCQLAGS